MLSPERQSARMSNICSTDPFLSSRPLIRPNYFSTYGKG